MVGYTHARHFNRISLNVITIYSQLQSKIILNALFEAIVENIYEIFLNVHMPTCLEIGVHFGDILENSV